MLPGTRSSRCTWIAIKSLPADERRAERYVEAQGLQVRCWCLAKGRWCSADPRRRRRVGTWTIPLQDELPLHGSDGRRLFPPWACHLRCRPFRP